MNNIKYITSSINDSDSIEFDELFDSELEENRNLKNSCLTRFYDEFKLYILYNFFKYKKKNYETKKI
jgi:hypothetical protein